MNGEVLHWGVLIVVFVWLIIAGRLFCGKVCPVGYAQDFVFKIPFFVKVKTFKFDKYIRLLKYVNVFINLVLFPLLVFLGYMAPENEEDGPPKILLAALAASLVFAVLIQRPFCKYICHVGTVSSLFNKISFYKYRTLHKNCVQCGLCVKKCKMDIVPYTMKNSLECIRCGLCKKACPKNALAVGFHTKRRG